MLLIMRIRKQEYKPLLFTTTVRNPERIKDFIKVIANYNNKVLTNEVIMKIVKDMIAGKYYYTMYEKSNAELNAIYSDADAIFTNEQLEDIIENSPQDHKEAGFDKGWPSRFDTWYKFIKELGFVYYEMNKPIEISETGNLLLAAELNENPELEEQAFLNALVKYQRNNPFRRVLNENAPFTLVLEVLKLLKNDSDMSDAGINVKEIPFFLCAKDNNAERIYTKIKELRKKYGFEYSDETVYELCFEELEVSEEQENRFKITNIMKEMPDDFIRKLRLTGLITIRGYGKFIDFNSTELDKINYILETYSDYNKYDNEYDYYMYMSKIDAKLINIETKEKQEITAESTLGKWAEYFEWNTIKDELQILACNGKSKDSVLKIISGPTRLEFLISIAIKKTFENVNVKPNYTVDDEGLPRRHASGGLPDIECYDTKYNSLFEVTLLTGTQQNIREMPSICRHLRDQILKNINSFSVFIAPTLHNDSIEYAKFIKFKDNLDIVPLSINEFIATAEMNSNLEKLLLLKSC